MNAIGKRTFLLLIVAQALHSIEEYYFALWQALAPARYLSGLISSNPAFGFAVINAAIVAFGAWSYMFPVRNDRSYAIRLAWFWTILEFANGVGHLSFALSARSYFPGAYTAPLLLVLSGFLAMQLMRRAHAA